MFGWERNNPRARRMGHQGSTPCLGIFPGQMDLIFFVLSVAGFLAALRRLALATFRLFKGGVEALVMREVASTRAEHGDVTGLLEARARKRATRGSRWRALAIVVFWAALLSAPLFTRTPVPIYAAYTILWWWPRGRRRAAS